MQLFIQQYEHFHFSHGESLNDTFSRFQKLLNSLKLYGRIYPTKDTNLKFLRALPKEWKPMTVALRQSHDFHECSLEKLYTELFFWSIYIISIHFDWESYLYNCCLILYIVNNLVSNGTQKIRLLVSLYNIIKAHSLSGVGLTTGISVVLFGIGLSWL